MGMADRVVLWRRLDDFGAERCQLRQTDDGWRLAGTVVAVAGAVPALIEYQVDTDQRWLTREVAVTATIGAGAPVNLRLSVDAAGQWQAARQTAPPTPWLTAAELFGLNDIDLAFSPVTNILPFRRLQPTVGETIAVTAAWLRFPELVIEPLPQTYHRLNQHRYSYASHGGAFTAELLVDEFGLIRRYEGLFERVAVSD